VKPSVCFLCVIAVSCTLFAGNGSSAADSIPSSAGFPLLSGDSWTFVKEGSNDIYVETVENGTFDVNGVATKRGLASDVSQMFNVSGNVVSVAHLLWIK
jgi:hypothetical protein